MIEVAGMWELGWNTPIMEADLWEYAMREFGVEHLNMTPISGIATKWIEEYRTLDEVITAKSELTPVFVDEHGEVELEDFIHPKNALYIFGKGNFSPFSNMADKTGAQSVRIGSMKPGLLWPHQALAVVLYHRSKQ